MLDVFREPFFRKRVRVRGLLQREKTTTQLVIRMHRSPTLQHISQEQHHVWTHMARGAPRPAYIDRTCDIRSVRRHRPVVDLVRVWELCVRHEQHVLRFWYLGSSLEFKRDVRREGWERGKKKRTFSCVLVPVRGHLHPLRA